MSRPRFRSHARVGLPPYAHSALALDTIAREPEQHASRVEEIANVGGMGSDTNESGAK